MANSLLFTVDMMFMSKHSITYFRCKITVLVFTALHSMQGGLVTRKLSVRLSVCQRSGLWQNGRKICPDFYTIQQNI